MVLKPSVNISLLKLSFLIDIKNEKYKILIDIIYFSKYNLKMDINFNNFWV